MERNTLRSVLPGAVVLVGMVSVGLGAGYLARRRTRDVEPAPPASSIPRRAPAVATVVTPRPARCGESPTPMPGRATQGGAITASPSDEWIAVADSDRDVLELLSVSPTGVQRVRSIRTGSMPTQAVFSTDGRVFVTERGAHRVSVYRASNGERLCSADVPDEPIGIAIAPDERSVLVTSGVSAKLTALDTSTFTERFRVDAGRSPRGVVVSPDGRHAFVSHVAGAPLSAFDLDGDGAREHTIPAVPIPADALARTTTFIGEGLPGNTPGSFAAAASPMPSQAHAVLFDPQQQTVVVPFMVNRTGREVPAAARLDFYGAGSVDPVQREKVSFALGVFDVAQDRWRSVAIRPERSQTTTQTLRIGNRAFERDALTGMAQARVVAVDDVRIPSAATLSADGTHLEVVSTGTDRVVSFPLTPPANAAVVPVASRRALRDPDVAAASSIGTAVATPTPAPAPTAAPHGDPAPFGSIDAPMGVVALRDGRHVVFSLVEHAVEVRAADPATNPTRIVLGDDPLPPDVSRGRRLFLAADDAHLSSGGLSCGGCHPDGSDDGLTWFLQRGPRQTPTLPGRMTPPFNWNGSAWTMEENVAQTVRRLGGSGLSMSDVDALAAYVTRGTREPTRVEHGLNDLERRGQELFAGSAACTTCHDPSRNFTDGQPHELGGLGADEREPRFDTPSLRFIAATAPYFHDGRYATLEAMLRDPTHRMGRVEQLSANDVDALGAYLRTL